MTEKVDKKQFDALMSLYIATDAMFQQLFEKVINKEVAISLAEPSPDKFCKSKDEVISEINRLNSFEDDIQKKKDSIKKCGCGDTNCSFYKDRIKPPPPPPCPENRTIKEGDTCCKKPTRPPIEDIREDDVSNEKSAPWYKFWRN